MGARLAILLAAGIATVPSAGAPRFLLADGRSLEMHGRVYVWCGRWDDGARIRTLRIQQGSPLAPPWWSIEIQVRLARRGVRVRLPTLSGRTASVFVGDPHRDVEASSDGERSSGSLTILSDAHCAAGTPIRLRIDARLAAEEAGGPSVRVEGSFVGVVGRQPGPGVQP